MGLTSKLFFAFATEVGKGPDNILQGDTGPSEPLLGGYREENIFTVLQ